jgi:uncharacterized C2H2 Zn-finger protein
MKMKQSDKCTKFMDYPHQDKIFEVNLKYVCHCNISHGTYTTEKKKS